MGEGAIPQQLMADCYYLGRLGTSALLLNRNAAVPWFIVVPQTPLCDVLDLPEAQRHAVLAQCAAVSEFIKRELGYQKVNVAGLGNVVSAMHLHVIGRSEQDPCWPQPVWGNLPEGVSYSVAQLREWQSALIRAIGLIPETL
jgi:diadenosine tetraphosphate (Ap4A) HIT family hydrolase